MAEKMGLDVEFLRASVEDIQGEVSIFCGKYTLIVERIEDDCCVAAVVDEDGKEIDAGWFEMVGDYMERMFGWIHNLMEENK